MTPRLVCGLAAAFALAATACKDGGARARPADAGPADPLRDDLDRICNAVALSGADQDPSAQGTYILAQWLDANITSAPGRAFLVDFARLGSDKAARIKMLEDSAVRVGLPDCPLIAFWQ